MSRKKVYISESPSNSYHDLSRREMTPKRFNSVKSIPKIHHIGKASQEIRLDNNVFNKRVNLSYELEG